jgi:hypothetical protein
MVQGLIMVTYKCETLKDGTTEINRFVDDKHDSWVCTFAEYDKAKALCDAMNATHELREAWRGVFGRRS